MNCKPKSSIAKFLQPSQKPSRTSPSSAESEASFETIAFLAGKMDSLSLPAIFTIEKGNQKIANAVLAASKKSKEAQILTLNSMQSVTEQQIIDGMDYLSIMKSNLDVLKNALK